MIPIHNAPTLPNNPLAKLKSKAQVLSFTLRDRLSDTLKTVKSTDFKSLDYTGILKTFLSNSKNSLSTDILPFIYNNIIPILASTFFLLGLFLNYRSTWSLTLSCIHKNSLHTGTCTLTRTGHVSLSTVLSPTYIPPPPVLRFPTSDLTKARTVRLTLTPDRYDTTLGNVVEPEGLSRKRKRALRYGYVVAYHEIGHGEGEESEAGDGNLVEVVMGRGGIGRKRSAEKVKKINRFVEDVKRNKDRGNPDERKLEIKEGRSVCVSGILMLIAGVMVGGWGLLVWLIEGDEYKRD